MYILSCNLPQPIINLLKTAYNSILIIVPVGIVLFGVIDFLKAGMGADSKLPSTKTFIKRIITGALVFFVFILVQFIFTQILPSETGASTAFGCAQQILG